jgi:phosphoribosylglycinamide formyltransferase-1
MTRIGTLASGRGSNFNALVTAWKKGSIPGAEFVVLVSDQPGAGALDVARGFGVEAVTLQPRDFPSREAQEDAVIAQLKERKVDLVCLAGYMRILSPKFIGSFPGRILNIHPALLPSFPGLHGQKQAVEYGVKVSGATVHFVDAGCDTGPVIVQATVPVLDGDTEETLGTRILKEEHRIYPEAVRLFCQGRLKVSGRHVRITPE